MLEEVYLYAFMMIVMSSILVRKKKQHECCVVIVCVCVCVCLYVSVSVCVCMSLCVCTRDIFSPGIFAECLRCCTDDRVKPRSGVAKASHQTSYSSHLFPLTLRVSIKTSPGTHTHTHTHTFNAHQLKKNPCWCQQHARMSI